MCTIGRRRYAPPVRGGRRPITPRFYKFIPSIFRLFNLSARPPHPPVNSPSWGRQLPPKLGNVDQSRQCHSVLACAHMGKLVDVAPASIPCMSNQIFQFFQPVQMDFQLGQSPARELPRIAPRETIIATVDGLSLATLSHHLRDERHQASRLRWQFIEAAPQRVMGEAVSQRQVVNRDFNVVDDLSVMSHLLPFALVLEQERHALDENEVLGMIAPCPCPVIGERQPIRVGIDDDERLEKSLGVPVQLQDAVAFSTRETARQSLPRSLCCMHGSRLRSVLAHRQHNAAVQEFFINVDGRRGQEDGDGAADRLEIRATQGSGVARG